MEFLKGIFDGKTLGESHLGSINAAQNEFGAREVEPMMFYGDPALKIHVPSRTLRTESAQVTVNGTTVTVTAPGTNLLYNDDSFLETYLIDEEYADEYDEGFFEEVFDEADGINNVYVVVFNTDKPVSRITQLGSVPAPLGWTNKFIVNEHNDGTSTVYFDVRFYEIDNSTGEIIQSISELEYTFE